MVNVMRVISLIAILFAFGCSNTVTDPNIRFQDNSTPIISAQKTNHWTWGHWTIRISEDHNSAEVIPLRQSSLHLNVTPFVEGPPCPDCLWIGKAWGLPDGTVKLQINLRHPYYWNPEYTGFDVRGIVIFKATDYWENGYFFLRTEMLEELMKPLLINYSDPEKGGAALLNQDGYTLYLNPLLEYEKPILNYSKAGKAVGDSPDCTINAYKLFADDSPRRMFKTTDQFVRTYHIQPPAGGGAFEFGYVISACWAKPDVMPVTNPETDFPINANCEDPYEVSCVQLHPIYYGLGYEPCFKVTVKHAPGNAPITAGIQIPTLSTKIDYIGYKHDAIRWSANPSVSPAEDVTYIDAETTQFVMRIKPGEWPEIGTEIVPGNHLGFLMIESFWPDGSGDPEWGYISQLFCPTYAQPLTVYAENDG